AAYTCTAMPLRVRMSPLPATVNSPSMKSRGSSWVGSGDGSQRSRFGSASISSNGVPRSAPLPIRRNAGCRADGRIRYTQVRRFTPLGWVNAVPLNCSAYSPSGACCGELRPSGSAPATASVANSLPNPLEYLNSSSAMGLAYDASGLAGRGRRRRGGRGGGRDGERGAGRAGEGGGVGAARRGAGDAAVVRRQRPDAVRTTGRRRRGGYWGWRRGHGAARLGGRRGGRVQRGRAGRG